MGGSSFFEWCNCSLPAKYEQFIICIDWIECIQIIHKSWKFRLLRNCGKEVGFLKLISEKEILLEFQNCSNHCSFKNAFFFLRCILVATKMIYEFVINNGGGPGIWKIFLTVCSFINIFGPFFSHQVSK